MLRFLRKYNKYILVVGGCLLMVSFLIQDVATRMQTSANDPVVGEVDGREIRNSELTSAAAEMRMLADLSPLLEMGQGVEPLQWVLLQHDAERMGLAASVNEARAILKAAGTTDLGFTEVARQYKATEAQVFAAVRRWAVGQQYISLASGVAYVSAAQRLEQARQFAEMIAQLQRQPVNWQQARFAYMTSVGRPALSEPMMKRFVYDQRAEVVVTALEVPATRYLDTQVIESPTDAEKRDLFEKHKDDFKGEGKPYGFGYKVPDRVKLEYLAFPYNRAVEQVEKDKNLMIDLEAEALKVYERNKSSYIIPAAPDEDDKKEGEKEGEKEGDAATQPPKTDDPAGETKPDADKPDESKPQPPDPSKGDEQGADKGADKPADATKQPAPADDKPAADKPSGDQPSSDKPGEPGPTGAPGQGADETKPADEGATQDAPTAAADEDKPSADAEPAKDDATPADASPAEPQPTDTPPSDTKPTDTPPADAKDGDAKPADDKAASEPQYQPFYEVRQRILENLKKREAELLTAKMVRRAQSILRDNIVPLGEPVDGYYNTDKEGWAPVPLSDVADKVQQEFGVRPDLIREDQSFIDRQLFGDLAGIGSATLSFQNRVFTAAHYAFSARPFIEEGSTDPLASLHLQVNVAGLPLARQNMGQYIFRLIEAQAAHAPPFEGVADEVDRDVRRLKAYKLMVQDREKWTGDARARKIEDIATEMGLKALTELSFQKRITDDRQGLTVPTIREIGKSERFVDEVFGLVQSVAQDGSIEAVPAEQRCGAVPVDHRLGMVLFRVDKFTPMTLKDFNDAVANGTAAFHTMAGIESADVENPLSLDSLIKRTGFEYDRGDEDEDETDEKVAAGP